MARTLFTIFIIIILAGCQPGTPRYGGGLNRQETDAETTQKQEKASKYGVDPIAMGQIIDRYLGKAYSGKGASEKGYDCSEFVGAVYSEYASVHLPRTVENLFKTGREVETGKLYFGDLVFFDTGGKGVSHVGIYVGFDEFVHSSSTEGVVISNLNDKYYQERYLGARRVMK